MHLWRKVAFENGSDVFRRCGNAQFCINPPFERIEGKLGDRLKRRITVLYVILRFGFYYIETEIVSLLQVRLNPLVLGLADGRICFLFHRN